MISRLKDFLKESKKEFKRINWPTFKETRKLTAVVILMSLAVAVFLGVLDFIFTSLLSEFFVS